MSTTSVAEIWNSFTSKISQKLQKVGRKSETNSTSDNVTKVDQNNESLQENKQLQNSSSTSPILDEKEKAKNSDEHKKMIMADDRLMEEVKKEVQEHLSKETGRERLIRMFVRESTNEKSPEVVLAASTALNAGMVVFVVTSAFGGQLAGLKFMEKNQHTAFTTRFMAMRRYNDTVFFGALKFGMKMGARAGIFAGLFMLTSQAVAVYRNKSSVWEYMIGGASTCSFLRMGHGWRGMVSGGIIGSFFGLAGGAAIFGLLKFSSLTQEERHYEALVDQYVELKEVTQLTASTKSEAMLDAAPTAERQETVPL